VKLKTSEIPAFIFSGVKPSEIAEAPNGSVSISKVFFSATANEAARLTAVVVFPTPPFGKQTDIILQLIALSITGS
jgi:hypothetical protein